MNLLAHAYLSQHHPQILLGNMIGDDVKGMQIRLYPPLVRAGIQLHRSIDSFTDQHPLLINARNIYRPAVRLYAGPLMDITLDYFLAGDPTVNTPQQWQSFANWAYTSLAAASSWHVGGFRRYFPYLREENWLVRYQERSFIENAMAGLLKRVGLSDKSSQVINSFQDNLSDLAKVYQGFFPALKAYSDQKARTLMNQLQ